MNEEYWDVEPTGAWVQPYPILVVPGADLHGPEAYFLRDSGVYAYDVSLVAMQRVDLRARILGDSIDRMLVRAAEDAARGRNIAIDKVHLIAFSQGGLDARYLISTLGYADKVASLTTIATPHRGSRVADRALVVYGTAAGAWVTNVMLRLLVGVALDTERARAALYGLGTEASVAFNKANPDVRGVYYQSYAGVTFQSFAMYEASSYERDCSGLNGPAPKAVDFIADTASEEKYVAAMAGGLKNEINDGVVTVASARWTNFRGCIPGHHNDLPSDTAFFLDLARTLTDSDYALRRSQERLGLR